MMDVLHHLSQFDVLNVNPFPFIVIPFALSNAVSCRPKYRERRFSWLRDLIMTVLCGSGGSTLRAVVLSQRFEMLVKESQIGILLLALAWLLVRVDAIHAFLSTWPMRLVLTPCEWLLRVRSLCTGLEKTPSVYPGSVTALLAVGLAHGCGGGFIIELSDGLSGRTVEGKLNKPVWANVLWALCSTVFVIITTNPAVATLLGGPLLNAEPAYRMVITTCVVVAWASVAVGRPVDPIMGPIEWFKPKSKTPTKTRRSTRKSKNE